MSMREREERVVKFNGWVLNSVVIRYMLSAEETKRAVFGREKKKCGYITKKDAGTNLFVNLWPSYCRKESWSFIQAHVLTFHPLEALSCFRLSWFLPFHDTWISRQETSYRANKERTELIRKKTDKCLSFISS